MRMRRKKHLEEKIAGYSDILSVLESDDKNFNTAPDVKEFIDYGKIFGNGNPVWLEVGCGKGKFICETAKQNPDINYIAVEKCANVITDACKNAVDVGIKNLHFIKCSAEYLGKYLPEKSVDGIYLNFSCPYPKNKYESHRLTSSRFLKIYKEILKEGAGIFQKTDNMHFFEYSIEQFSKNGYYLENVSLDLHNSNFEGNITTEYEEKFVSMGLPIYRLEAFPKNN